MPRKSTKPARKSIPAGPIVKAAIKARKAAHKRTPPEAAPISPEAATDVLRREYHDEIRACADNAIREFNDRKDDSPDMSDILHEMIDGHHDVIYTWQAQRVLWLSDNSDAYEEAGMDFAAGTATANWSVMAYWAMRADVEAMVNARTDEWEAA